MGGLLPGGCLVRGGLLQGVPGPWGVPGPGRGSAPGGCLVLGGSGPGAGSHFSGPTKFHDISMIFPGFLVNFQVFFDYF